MKLLTPKQQHWTSIIEDWSNSGLSQASYCRQHQLDANAFYRWKNRLAKNHSLSDHTAEFLPLAVIEDCHGESSIELHVAGVEIRYQRETDPDLLTQQLQVLRAGV